jgi:hypothetical protein
VTADNPSYVEYARAVRAGAALGLGGQSMPARWRHTKELAEAVLAYGRAEYERGLADAFQDHFCNPEDA